MNPMKSKRAMLWGAAVFLVLAGVMASSILLPQRAATPEGPDVRVPGMQNAPEPGQRQLELEVPAEGR